MNARCASRVRAFRRALPEVAVTFVGELVRGRPAIRRDDHGATSVEYALMVTFIAVVIVAAVFVFGQNLIPLFNVPSSALTGP